MATYCQLCGLPLQHDHYVPDRGMFGIYRSGERSDFTPVVAFGDEHAWLCDAVGLRVSPEQTPVIRAGQVHDGSIDVDADDNHVLDGIDDRVGLHRYCYELAGSPELWAPADRVPDAELLAPYRQQLFAFDEAVAAGLGWTLIDPRTPDGARNRERITAAIDVYRGARPSSIRREPSPIAILRYMVEHDASAVDVAIGEPPVFHQAGERVTDAFGALSERGVMIAIYAVLTDAQRDELDSTGRVSITFKVKDLGGFQLDAHYDARGLHARYARRPV